MLLFYRQDSDKGKIIPVALIDAQRSDDRFGTFEINNLVKSNMPVALKGKDVSSAQVFSVEYTATFSHNGVNPGDAWRTRFFGMVKNPPGVMVSLFSPQYFVSQESMEALKAVIQRIVNPQKAIVYAVMCVRGVTGTVSRPFVAYAAPHRPIPDTGDTEMQILGAGFDDIIIRAKKAVRFDKKTSLSAQLSAWLKPEFNVIFEEGVDQTAKPVSEIFRPAMPLNEALGEVCTQNEITFVQEGKTIKFRDTRTKGSPKKSGGFEGSFLGSAGIMIYNFALSNYTQAQFSSDVFDIPIFGTMTIFNDIQSAVFTGLNKVATPPSEQKKSVFRAIASLLTPKIDKYGFYILAYDLVDGREMKQLKIMATNNWLVSQAKVEGMLEQQVYINALKKAGQ